MDGTSQALGGSALLLGHRSPTSRSMPAIAGPMSTASISAATPEALPDRLRCAAARLGPGTTSTPRAVIFPGFFEREKASYSADTGQTFGEVAYPTSMGAIALEPFAVRCAARICRLGNTLSTT
jgi:hypothetical protein